MQEFQVFSLLIISVTVICGEPDCEIPCGPNADCVKSNICQCSLGYLSVLSEQDGLPFCKPICNIPCMEYATCVAPNVCDCVSGYQMDDDGRLCVEATHVHATTQVVQHSKLLQVSSGNSLSSLATEAASTMVPSVYSNSDENMINDNSELSGDYVYKMTQMPENKGYNYDCPPSYTYDKGGCREKLNSAECNSDKCPPGAYCDAAGNCVCSESFVLVGEKGCLRKEELQHSGFIGTTELVYNDNRWLHNFITALGLACMVLAMLVLVSFLYKTRTN